MIWRQSRDFGVISFLGCGPLSLDIKIKECSHNTRNTLEEAYGLSMGQEDSMCLILAEMQLPACGILEVQARKERCY